MVRALNPKYGKDTISCQSIMERYWIVLLMELLVSFKGSAVWRGILFLFRESDVYVICC